MSDYNIVTIESLSQWKGLSQSWNVLLTKSSANTIFLTWEWLFSWAETYLNKTRKLFILTVFKDDELVAIAPWYIQRLKSGAFTAKQIQFLGAPEGGSDYLDVIIKKGQEQKVTLRLCDFLLKEAASQWDCCMLEDLSSNSLFLLHFLKKIEEEGKYAEIRPGSFCPTVVLPKKGEDLFTRYSSHRRLQYRRHFKILKSKGELNHSSQDGGNIEKALDDFCNFYETKNEKNDKSVRSFIVRYAAQSRAQDSMQVDLFTLNGILIGGLLNLKYGDTLSQYLMAVDKQYIPQISLGNILVGMCLGRAIDNGFTVYDFLKGPEPYKFHWAESGRSAVRLYFYQKRVAPLFLAFGKLMKYAAKTVLR